MGAVSSLPVTRPSYSGSVDIMAVPNTPYSTTSNVSLSTVAASEYSLTGHQENMQRLNANLYAVFLEELKRDGVPEEVAWLDEEDICHRELPFYDKDGLRNGRTLCESLRDTLHVAQYLAYHRILWFNPEKGAIDQGKKGRPRMCKCEVVNDGEPARPRYKDE